MYSIHGTIEGLAPILINRMAADALDGTTGKRRDPIAEAEAKVYVASDGDLCLPKWTLKRVLLDGAYKLKGLKVNKISLRDLIASQVFVAADPSFGVKRRDFIHECVGRIPPKKGAAAIIRRPALDTGWTLAFVLTVLDDAIPSMQLNRALEVAGLYVGVGAWRPEFGRFLVTKFEEANNAKAV